MKPKICAMCGLSAARAAQYLSVAWASQAYVHKACWPVYAPMEENPQAEILTDLSAIVTWERKER